MQIISEQYLDVICRESIKTDYLLNHLYDPEMKQLNIFVTNSIQ